MSTKKSEKGFTLMEMMIVIVIIGILASIMLPNYTAIQNSAKNIAVKAIGHTLQVALQSYYTDTGKYPPGTKRHIAELATLLTTEGYMINIPQNPFTNNPYTNTDEHGKIEYTYTDSDLKFEINLYGQNNETLLQTLKN